jgi:septal ring factor EnvC (AmiA/AmiB activator)
MDIMLWEAEKHIAELQRQIQEKDDMIKALQDVVDYNEEEIKDLHAELNKSQNAEYMYALENKVMRLKKLTESLLKSQRNFVFSYRF